MDIRAFRYAVTPAEELHVGRAAQRHCISPQPFGRHIQRLERELGTQLFERTSRRVTLTPAGRTADRRGPRTLLDTVDSLIEHHHRRRAADGKLRTLGVLGFGLAERWTDLTAAVHGHDLTMPRVVVVPARSPLADADRLTEADPRSPQRQPNSTARQRLVIPEGPSSVRAVSRSSTHLRRNSPPDRSFVKVPGLSLHRR